MSCGLLPHSTKDENQETRESEMTPSQLVLCTYRANCDFSQGPQIIGSEWVEIFRKQNIPPIKSMPDGKMPIILVTSNYIYLVQPFMKQTPGILGMSSKQKQL